MSTRSPALLVTMCVGYFLVLLDVTVMNVALPALRAGLHVSAPELTWVVTGYAVPFAALLLPAGATGDRIGHRAVVLCGLGVFGLGSLACALAPGLVALVGARAVQGVGAALLLPGTLAVIADAYPGSGDRGRAIGVWAAVGGCALPAGPVVGGLLVQAAGWRSVFWLNIPLVLVAVLVAARLLPTGGGDRARRPDLLGGVLAAAGLGLLVFAAAQRTWWLLPVGALVLAAFLGWQRRAAQPSLPLALFRRRWFGLANLGALVMNTSAQGMLFLLTLLLQDVQGRSPAQAGLAALPAFLPLALLPPLAARLLPRFGAGRVAAAAMVATGIGIALLATIGAATRYPAMLPVFLLWGSGLGVLTPALVTSAVSAVPASMSGLASAVNNTVRQAGGSIGVAVCAAIAGPLAAGSATTGFDTAALVMGGACLLTAIPLTYGNRASAGEAPVNT